MLVVGNRVAAVAAETDVAGDLVAADVVVVVAGDAAEMVEPEVAVAVGAGIAGAVAEIEVEELKKLLLCKHSRVRRSRLSECVAHESMSGGGRVKLRALRSESAQRPVRRCPCEHAKCWQAPPPKQDNARIKMSLD